MPDNFGLTEAEIAADPRFDEATKNQLIIARQASMGMATPAQGGYNATVPAAPEAPAPMPAPPPMAPASDPGSIWAGGGDPGAAGQAPGATPASANAATAPPAATAPTPYQGTSSRFNAIPAAAPAEGEAAASPVGPFSGRAQLPELVDLINAENVGGGMGPAQRRAQANYLNLRGMDKAVSERQAGRLDTLASAEEEHGRQVAVEAALTGQAVQDLDAQGAERDAEHARITQKMQTETKAAQDAALKGAKDLDPQRLLGPAGNRIMFALAAAFGAIGQGLLKQDRNQVMDTINTMLDRDFDAQKAGVAGKEQYASVLGQNLARYRQIGLDEQAQRAAYKSDAFKMLALKTDGMSSLLKGTESKTAHQNAADELRRQGLQADMAMQAQLAKPTGGKRKTQAEVLKEAQALALQNEQLRQGQIKTQAEADKATAAREGGGEEFTATDRRLQSSLADKYTASRTVTNTLQEFTDAVKADKLGTGGMMFPNLTGNQYYDKALKKLVGAAAAARGGPITMYDQQIEESIADIKASWYNPATWSDNSMQQRITALLDLSKKRDEAILNGQPEKIVRQLKKDYTAPAESESQKATRLGADGGNDEIVKKRLNAK